LYHALAERAAEDQPLRFVMWSWPTWETRRVLRDFRAAYDHVDSQSYYLGWFLSGIAPDCRVGLVGFSMGAGIISGAAHGLGGGEVAGQELNAEAGPTRIRAVYWSPAMDNDWLLPGHHFGNAMSRIDQLYVLINSCDPVLKRFHLAEPHSRARALGYTGLACPAALDDDRDRVTQEDGCCILGREHSFYQHIGSTAIVATTATYLLWDPIETDD